MIDCMDCGQPMLVHEAESDDEPTVAECPDCATAEVIRPAVNQ